MDYGEKVSRCYSSLDQKFQCLPVFLNLTGTSYFHNPEFIFPWTIMDEVMVPENIEPGDYVLSFRWDCEQTPQVWNACSSIRIL